jgi:hypothetical protein
LEIAQGRHVYADVIGGALIHATQRFVAEQAVVVDIFVGCPGMANAVARGIGVAELAPTGACLIDVGTEGLACADHAARVGARGRRSIAPIYDLAQPVFRKALAVLLDEFERSSRFPLCHVEIKIGVGMILTQSCTLDKKTL